MVYGFNVEERKLEDMTATIMGIMYAVFMPYHIVLIDQELSGAIWLVFLTAFGTDIMAYFTGMALGKHKLCSKLSPKKSVEGAVGGVIGSVVLCGLYGHFFMEGTVAICLVVGFFGSIVAQLGDLAASAFKRQMGIKDYGNLIPGHGGILDRFDSVLFTAPMVYYYIVLVLM
jgi:phosphatidate cytidylyltransferase